MEELTFQQQAVIWGQAYEIFVKRGVLGCMTDRGLVSLDDPHLKPWRETRTSEVYKAVVRELQVIDETLKEHIHAALQHLATVAYGLGYTAMREYLRKLRQPLANQALIRRALWCPLTLPSQKDFDAERDRSCAEIHRLLGLKGPVDPALADKGRPARADFLLWLSGTHKEDQLLVQEYSYDSPAKLEDFSEETAHLEELMRYRRYVDSRSVFARVTAEVEEERFELSDDLKAHLGALTSDNKPFYKLCQAASYAESTVQVLERHELLVKPCAVRVLAITPNGLESLAARYLPGGAKDPRFALMQQLGTTYRKAVKRPDDDEAGLTQEVDAVFRQILSRLPNSLKSGLKGLREIPKPGTDYRFEFEEKVPEFANPMQRYSTDEALALVEESPEINDYFGGSAKNAITRALEDLRTGDITVALRDLHAAAIVAGLGAAKRGKLNVIGLEGNPGIGKTTAVTRYLAQQSSGYFFLGYSSKTFTKLLAAHHPIGSSATTNKASAAIALSSSPA